MAINPDVVASALQDLAPGYSELFTLWHPIMERVVLRGNVDRGSLKGPYREFVVVTDGPGTVTQVTTGSEVIAGGRRQNAQRGTEYAPRLIYAFDVPGKDLAEGNGENDLAKIIKRYPELALSDFHERIARQISCGNGTDVSGFVTLNGDTTYNPQGAAVAPDGLIDFAAPAAQAGTVHNLNKATVSNWQNQYGQISSFATDGKATMRQVYYKASRQGSKASGPIDLLLGDESSYLNYIDDLDDQVRVMKVESDKAPGQVRQGIPFLEADFFLEEELTTQSAQFATGGANNGVIYMLQTDSFHLFTLGHDSGMETKGDFAIRGPIRIPEQDMWRYEYVLNMGMYCDQLRTNGVVTGGAIS